VTGSQFRKIPAGMISYFAVLFHILSKSFSTRSEALVFDLTILNARPAVASEVPCGGVRHTHKKDVNREGIKLAYKMPNSKEVCT
jgi:hypothetical protein